MARTNFSAWRRTHENAPVAPITASEQLRRSVLSCLLFENEFYEDGEEIAARIYRLAHDVPMSEIAALAIEARERFHLRHAPLLLLTAMVHRQFTMDQHRDSLTRDTIARVVSRADEAAELLSIYWKLNPHARTNDKTKRIQAVPASIRRGLARAVPKWDEYSLAKYDREDAVKIRDVLRIARPKPKSDEQRALWGRAVKRELALPDTWESLLVRGGDKRKVFTDLLYEGKLGYMALLRNLRNMLEAEVDEQLIREAILARKGARRVLPFRYVAAARAAPSLEPVIDQALIAAVGDLPPLSGLTTVLVDVSGSMKAALSKRSDLTRMTAAATLASVIPGQRRVFTFSNNVVEVPARIGMAGVDAIINSQEHGGTFLGGSVRKVLSEVTGADRLIVISDEQSHDYVDLSNAGETRCYMINIASAANGVGYPSTGWTSHIDGFSESVIRFIWELERAPALPEPKPEAQAAQ